MSSKPSGLEMTGLEVVGISIWGFLKAAGGDSVAQGLCSQQYNSETKLL